MSIVDDDKDDDNKQWYEFPDPVAAEAVPAAERAAREEPARHRGAAARNRQQLRRPADARNARTSDGTYNDLTCPRMGSAGMRFGRNVPLSETFPDTANLMNPSPRRVSLELLTRTTFQPATILNVIAAAWIQFMVHDWFVHKKGAWSHTHDIPLDAGDAWHERPMRVPKTPADPPKVAGLDAPSGLHQREHALVGRLAGLRQLAVRAGVAARRARGQGARQPERPARCRSGHRPRDHRLHRERLGGPEPAARAVRARAQRDLRRAEEAQPAVGRRAAVPAGASRQLGAAGEDPHGRMVDRRSCRTRSSAPACAPTGTACSGSCRTSSPGSGQRRPARHSRFADRSSRRAVLAHRGVRVRLPHAHADAGRLHVLLGGQRRRARPVRAARAVRQARRRAAWRGSTRPISSTRSASRIRARCGCTTIRRRCRTWCRTTASASTSAPWTSCAIASAACRATTSSAGCSTSRR